MYVCVDYKFNLYSFTIHITNLRKPETNTYNNLTSPIQLKKYSK